MLEYEKILCNIFLKRTFSCYILYTNSYWLQNLTNYNILKLSKKMELYLKFGFDFFQ